MWNAVIQYSFQDIDGRKPNSEFTVVLDTSIRLRASEFYELHDQITTTKKQLLGDAGIVTLDGFRGFYVARARFERLHGFDDVLFPWGGEDIDLRISALNENVKVLMFQSSRRRLAAWRRVEPVQPYLLAARSRLNVGQYMYMKWGIDWRTYQRTHRPLAEEVSPPRTYNRYTREWERAFYRHAFNDPLMSEFTVQVDGEHRHCLQCGAAHSSLVGRMGGATAGMHSVCQTSTCRFRWKDHELAHCYEVEAVSSAIRQALRNGDAVSSAMNNDSTTVDELIPSMGIQYLNSPFRSDRNRGVLSPSSNSDWREVGLETTTLLQLKSVAVSKIVILLNGENVGRETFFRKVHGKVGMPITRFQLVSEVNEIGASAGLNQILRKTLLAPSAADVSTNEYVMMIDPALHFPSAELLPNFASAIMRLSGDNGFHSFGLIQPSLLDRRDVLAIPRSTADVIGGFDDTIFPMNDVPQLEYQLRCLSSGLKIATFDLPFIEHVQSVVERRRTKYRSVQSLYGEADSISPTEIDESSLLFHFNAQRSETEETKTGLEESLWLLHETNFRTPLPQTPGAEPLRYAPWMDVMSDLDPIYTRFPIKDYLFRKWGYDVDRFGGNVLASAVLQSLHSRPFSLKFLTHRTPSHSMSFRQCLETGPGTSFAKLSAQVARALIKLSPEDDDPTLAPTVANLIARVSRMCFFNTTEAFASLVNSEGLESIAARPPQAATSNEYYPIVDAIGRLNHHVKGDDRDVDSEYKVIHKLKTNNRGAAVVGEEVGDTKAEKPDTATASLRLASTHAVDGTSKLSRAAAIGMFVGPTAAECAAMLPLAGSTFAWRIAAIYPTSRISTPSTGVRSSMPRRFHSCHFR